MPDPFAYVPGDWAIWCFATSLVLDKIIHRLDSGDFKPAGFDPLPGRLARQRTSAAKVGDDEMRRTVSPTLAAVERIARSLAEQLLGAGCTDSEARDMLTSARRERERLNGPLVGDEMAAAMQAEPIPFIVES